MCARASVVAVQYTTHDKKCWLGHLRGMIAEILLCSWVSDCPQRLCNRLTGSLSLATYYLRWDMACISRVML